jgi:hypothetical protein
MRESQTTRILAELSSGQWVPVERFMDMHIPDYRSRICELKKRGHVFESRMMERPRADGSVYRSKDWADVDARDRLRDDVQLQVAAARNDVPDNRTRATIVTPAGSVTVMGGRLRLLTVDAMTDEIMRGLGID